jgi:rhodanese-related sulfurtransferase
MQDTIQNIVQFALHHWLLSGLFIVLLILLFIEEARSKGLLGQISPQELVQLINHESPVVIDIRNKDAFQSGHIVGSINIPQTSADLNPFNKYKDKIIVLVCAMGQKAGEIAVKLKKQQFERVHVLKGGINAWKNAQLPLKEK